MNDQDDWASEAAVHCRRPAARVNSRLVAATVNYAIGRGVSMREITAATGIKRTELIDDEARLPDEVILKIWRLLDSLPSDQSPALHMVSATSTSIFGPCKYLLRYAPSLKAARESMVRFGKVVADRVEIAWLDSHSTTSIQLWHPLDAGENGIAGEVGLAMLFRLVEECQQADLLVGVDFAHQPNGRLASYERFFGVPIRFGQARNTLHYRQEALEHPMRGADEQLFQYVQAHLELVEDRWLIPGQRNLLSQIYATAHANGKLGKFSVEELALSLRTNLRKLQRETKSHGLTITDILDEAREARAKELLADRSINMEEIAAALAYSDSRAFRRAFARWTKMTPAAYRNNQSR